MTEYRPVEVLAGVGFGCVGATFASFKRFEQWCLRTFNEPHGLTEGSEGSVTVWRDEVGNVCVREVEP